MPLDIVVGSQWGDEGKGRIIDLLARDADIVARFNAQGDTDEAAGSARWFYGKDPADKPM